MSSFRQRLRERLSYYTGGRVPNSPSHARPPRAGSAGDLTGASANAVSGPAGSAPAEDAGSLSVVMNDPAHNASQRFPSNFIKTSKYTLLTFLPSTCSSSSSASPTSTSWPAS